MPGLAELAEYAANFECPPPAPRPVLGTYLFTVEIRPEDSVGDRHSYIVTPGIWDRPGGGLCGRVRAQSVRRGEAGEASEWEEIGEAGPCEPVPEPEFVAGLAVLVLWLLAMREVGRCLRRIGEQYPPPPEDRSTWNDEPDELSM